MAVSPFPLVFGLDTFGDVTHDEGDRPLSHAQTIRNLVEQGVLADQVGLDFFGIGEHHTDDFPLSAADVVLAAIAARTARIHVGSAVTRSEEHTSELQSPCNLVCRLLLEKKKIKTAISTTTS